MDGRGNMSDEICGTCRNCLTGFTEKDLNKMNSSFHKIEGAICGVIDVKRGFFKGSKDVSN